MSSVNKRTYSGRDPGRRTLGWIAVVAFHLLVGWVLVTGTARKGLELIKKPIEAVVIQEVIIPPPPPPPPPPPKVIQKAPPKTEAPPPPFVPPVEVTPPVESAPVIAAAPTPPPEPQPIAPPTPPAPVPAPAPARAEIGVVCPTQVKPSMPRRALEDGIEGVVRAQVLIRNGAVAKVDILSGPQIFRTTVREAMLQYRCKSAEGDVVATQEFAFRLD